jgi:hypothetical protein
MSAGHQAQNRNAFERIIESLASSLGNSIGWLAEHGVLLVVYGVIWAAVGAGLLVNEATVSQAWSEIDGQHVVVQLLLWLLFLPVMVGLWIWHTDWPLLIRGLLLIGLAGWNLLVFLPRRSARPDVPGGGEVATGGE